VFRRRHRRLATAAVVWLSKPVLLLFALQLYTLGIAINQYVIAMDSLSSVVLIAASMPAAGYLSAVLNSTSLFSGRWRCSPEPDTGRKPSGADLAATNCLLALAVLRLGLDQPEADLASAVPIWLLLLHPLALFWYWARANVRRYVARRRGKVCRRDRHDDTSSGRRRRQFTLARKLLHVAGSLQANRLEDDQLHTVERITVV